MARRNGTGTDESIDGVVLLLGVGLAYAAWHAAQRHPLLATAAGVAVLAIAMLVIRRLMRARRRAAARRAELDRHIATADACSPDEFEHLVARLLTRDGFRDVRVTGGPGDLGADVTARFPDGRQLVVQCKRYTRRAVSSPDVQRFLGTVWTEHKADEGWMVTTSGFSRPARELGTRNRLRLLARDDLAAWMAASPADGRPPAPVSEPRT